MKERKLEKVCKDARLIHKPALYKCVRTEYCEKQVAYGQLMYCKVEFKRNKDSRWGK